MPKQPCDASDLVHFRNRIGEEGMELILAESIRVNTDHDNEDHFDTAFIDSTVQEKNITYPTDAKLHKKIIKNVLKIVHDNCLPLRQSYTRTLKGIYRSQRFRNHPKNRKKALKADCKRAGIEPTIGHLKEDHRLSRNFYKGVKGDAINVLLAAAAYNFKRAMRVLLYLIKRISIELVSTNFILKYSF